MLSDILRKTIAIFIIIRLNEISISINEEFEQRIYEILGINITLWGFVRDLCGTKSDLKDPYWDDKKITFSLSNA